MDNPVKIDADVIDYILSIQKDGEESMPKQEEAGRHVPGAEQFRAFIDEMPGGFFVYRADGTEEIIYANKALFRMFDCESEEMFRELTGNSFRGIVHPDDLEAVEKSIWEQIAASQYDLDYVEYRIISKTGEIRWVDDYGHFIHSEEAGDVFYVFVGDATERKSSHQETVDTIDRERKRYLDLVEGLSVGYESILYVNLDTDVVQAYRLNNRTNQLFDKELQIRQYGAFAEEYVGMWVHPEDRDIVIKATDPAYIRNKLSLGRTFHISYRVVEEDKINYIQLHIVNVGEGISQIVLGYRNMDAEVIHEMEQQRILEDALESAKASIIVKNAFLSNMSHDIRTPMNAIIGFTDLAKKHFDDRAKVRRYLNMIEASGNQLLRLLNDVLEIARIESGKIEIVERKCSLSEIVRNVHASVFPLAEPKRITVSMDFSGLVHDTVYNDERRLQQILLRLAGNAVKYTEDRGRVSIAVKEEEGPSRGYATYHFIVEDTGMGISENMLQHIFKPFERGKNTTQSGIHGAGLGLSITKSIVEMMGGTIDVVSEVGKRSCFTVTLSLRIDDTESFVAEQEEKRERQRNKARSMGSRRILVVEDTEINLEIEVEILKDAGYLVDTATDGSIAVDKVKNSRPGYYDLILMDIQMPVMDGYDATRAIRELKDPDLAGIPIVALSANTFDEDIRRSRESGMNAHMEKPIDTPQLMGVIGDMLGEV